MLIILDRDGVINRYEGEYICSPSDWDPLPGSIEAIAQLCRAGHRIAVATNQSGIARGYYSTATLGRMHDRMTRMVEEAGGRLASIRFCPHHPDEGCDCRKPQPGLLQSIRDELGYAGLEDAVMVGDSRKDLEAGHLAGCKRLVLVRTGNGRETEKELSERPLEAPVDVVDDLAAFVIQLTGRSDETP